MSNLRNYSKYTNRYYEYLFINICKYIYFLYTINPNQTLNVQLNDRVGKGEPSYILFRKAYVATAKGSGFQLMYFSSWVLCRLPVTGIQVMPQFPFCFYDQTVWKVLC